MINIVWTVFLSAVGAVFDLVLSWVFSVLPDNTVLSNFFHINTSGIDSAMVKVSNVLISFNSVFPFDQIFLIISMIFVFESITMLFLLTLYILQKVIEILPIFRG